MRAPRILRDAAGDNATTRALGALILMVFVQWVGASAVLPLLPLYLRHQGSSPAAIGAVISAFFVAGVLTQYAAGHLTDRIGHRRVIVGSLALYAVASVGFVASVGAGGYVLLRGLQGVGAGGVQVATLAFVGLVVPDIRRGRAFAMVIGAQTAGMAIGPFAGSLAGIPHLQWLFVGTAAASLAAMVPVLVATPHAARADRSSRQLAPLVVTRRLVGVMVLPVAMGLIIGVYDACWSLLMHSRGAQTWQIGLSWTLFCIPFAALSPIAGRVVDRFNRRRIAAIGLVSTCGFAVSYPFIPKVWLLIGLGMLEAVGVACTLPAAQAMLTECVESGALGRGQGLFSVAETAATAVAASVAGAMFGVTRWLPFLVAASAAVALIPVMLELTRGLGRTGTAPQPPTVAEAVAAGAPPG